MAIDDLYPLPVAAESRLVEIEGQLRDAGVRLLYGSMVDTAGVARGKAVHRSKVRGFHKNGLGCSPTWAVFCIDNYVAFTDRLGVAGDWRLRADLESLRVVDNGMAWAPVEVFDQLGQPAPTCTRGRLRQTIDAIHHAGLNALVGCELEMVLTNADGSPLATNGWQAYGLGPAMHVEAFIDELMSESLRLDLPIEQIHAEYATAQYEFSLAPTDPLTAADNVMFARLLACRVARRHGLAVSFSPLAYAGGAGNGAHLHFSFTRDGAPLFSGGDGPYGITAEGGSAIAGVVSGLPELVGALAGSVLSSARLQPGHWSGAFACWGLENREAAVRFCAATPGNPHGANVEVKCIDPSANPYLAVAAVLGMALDGVIRSVPLPDEVAGNPSELPDEIAGPMQLPATQADVLAALQSSSLAPKLLGEDLWLSLLAVRRHELDSYGGMDIEEVVNRFRFAWSI
jgi:glutamine synthetase